MARKGKGHKDKRHSPHEAVVTETNKTRFLKLMSEGYVVGVAAEKIGVARSTAYAWRDDPEFLARWNDAVATCTDRAESELYRRAIDQSDHLLQFYVEKRRPEVYGKRDGAATATSTDEAREQARIEDTRQRLKQLG